MAVNLSDLINNFEPYFIIFELMIILIISFIIFRLVSIFIKRNLLKKAKTKKQTSNVATFIDLLNFIFAIFLIIIAFSAYYGSLGELGFVAGLLTVALGWAL